MNDRPSRLVAILLSAAASAAVLPAQPAASVCDGRNHLTTQHQPWAFTNVVRVAAQLVPTSAIRAEGLEWFMASNAAGINFGAAAGIVEIRAEDPSTGGPSESVLASGSYTTPGFGGAIIIPPGGAWFGASFAQPVDLVPAQPYWVTYRPGPPFDAPAYTWELGVEDAPAGPDATPYALKADGTDFFGAIQTDHRLKFRILSSSCTPTSFGAHVQHFGSPCSGGVAGFPRIFVTGVPRVGNAGFSVSIEDAGAGRAVVLFWASGIGAGVPVAPGCYLLLDPASVVALAATGLNPIGSGTTNAQGIYTRALPVPGLASVAGFTVAFQAVVADAAGPIALGPGSTWSLTGAVLGVIGF